MYINNDKYYISNKLKELKLFIREYFKNIIIELSNFEKEFKKHGECYPIHVPPKSYSKWIREENVWSFERISKYLETWYKK